MGYKILCLHSERHNEKLESDEFFRAAKQAKEAVEKMHNLAHEMKVRFTPDTSDE
jgi:hypothetical protein